MHYISFVCVCVCDSASERCLRSACIGGEYLPNNLYTQSCREFTQTHMLTAQATLANSKLTLAG